jgi:inosine/xanthosine triphosphate pyrophosphatase family protein
MTRVTFITGNGFRHEEARRLLSGIDVERSRIALDKGTHSKLEAIAKARILDGYRQLQRPCFVENTELFLDTEPAFVGARFKRLHQELGDSAFAERFGGLSGFTRVVVAYTADGEHVQTFEGQSTGQIATKPRGSGGYGWDRLWIPDGFSKTLAELESSKYVVNMRLLPFLELGAELRGSGFDGVFESHVTVAPCDEPSFAATCDTLGVKAIFVELPQGSHRRQPMTGAHHRGSLHEVMLAVHQLARDIARAGFEVVRTKLEAVGRHRDIPQTDAEAALSPPTNYFEHHAKLLLPAGADEAAIREHFKGVDAHLSRGAPRADLRQRFVTLRSWGLGQSSADARFARVLALADELALPLRGRLREYTVYDSALELDTGWMA